MDLCHHTIFFAKGLGMQKHFIICKAQFIVHVMHWQGTLSYLVVENVTAMKFPLYVFTILILINLSFFFLFA